jgi:hypothetical protein
MEDRTIILSILGGINTAVFFFGHLSLSANPSSGPEGIGTAMLIVVAACFSALLSAFALERLYREFGRGILTWHKTIAVVLCVAPLLYYLLVDRRHTH